MLFVHCVTDFLVVFLQRSQLTLQVHKVATIPVNHISLQTANKLILTCRMGRSLVLSVQNILLKTYQFLVTLRRVILKVTPFVMLLQVGIILKILLADDTLKNVRFS
jgi:hypothetical protein